MLLMEFWRVIFKYYVFLYKIIKIYVILTLFTKLAGGDYERYKRNSNQIKQRTLQQN
jgi:hypothetical protein